MSKHRRSRSRQKDKTIDKYLSRNYVLLYVIFSFGLGMLYTLYKDENTGIRSLLIKSTIYAIVLPIILITVVNIIKYSSKNKSRPVRHKKPE